MLAYIQGLELKCDSLDSSPAWPLRWLRPRRPPRSIRNFATGVWAGKQLTWSAGPERKFGIVLPLRLFDGVVTAVEGAGRFARIAEAYSSGVCVSGWQAL